MAKITFHRTEDGRIIKETKYSGNVVREYVTDEERDRYETQRGAFAGLGCLTIIVFFVIAWFASNY